MTKPRIRVDQKGTVTAVNGVSIADGMANVISGLGMNNAKVAAGRYIPIDDAMERDNAFRASTWYGKIVRIPAADAVREWRAWQAEKEQIEAIEAEEKRLGLRQVVYQALLTARHTGGAAIIVGGLTGSAGQPLRMEGIRKGALKYLNVLGRDEITPGQRIRDPQSEWFGKPDKWTIHTDGSGLEIHPSRVILVNGRTVPGASRSQQTIWGDSLWVQMADSIRAADSAGPIIEALMHEAKVDVVRIKNMVSQMASGAAEQDYIKRWTMVAMLKSISNVLMLDGDDEHEQKQITWAGLPDVVKALLTIMAGAADIPVTRLTGEQQSGLSGADNGSLRHYYDGIKTIQELEYTPALQPLDEMLIRSALGDRPKEVWYLWNPLWQPSEKERAEVDKLEAEAVKIYGETGLVPVDALAEMTQNRLIESGSWPGADVAYDAAKADLDLPEVEGEEAPEDPSAITSDAKPRTLYVSRRVVNAAEIIAHFKGQGIKTTLPADDLHVTIAYSRQPVDWIAVGESWSGSERNGNLEVTPGGARVMERFGQDSKAVVMVFASSDLRWRHEAIKEKGASWDWDSYEPHITLSYEFDGDIDQIEPWRGKIVLGPERFAEIDENWSSGIKES